MEKINLCKNDEKNFSNSLKISHQQSIIKFGTYLNDIKIFFDFKKKKEIGFEDEDDKNKKIKNLIQMLKIKTNQVVLKKEMSNIGCGAHFSYIYDNSFNFFIFLIFLFFFIFFYFFLFY
jgi:hypothetical protein